MNPVYKTVLRVTVYSEDPSPVESEGLAELAEHIDVGSDVGEIEVIERVTITDPDKLRHELLSIGNDGEFFTIND